MPVKYNMKTAPTRANEEKEQRAAKTPRKADKNALMVRSFFQACHLLEARLPTFVGPYDLKPPRP